MRKGKKGKDPNVKIGREARGGKRLVITDGRQSGGGRLTGEAKNPVHLHAGPA